MSRSSAAKKADSYVDPLFAGATPGHAPPKPLADARGASQSHGSLQSRGSDRPSMGARSSSYDFDVEEKPKRVQGRQAARAARGSKPPLPMSQRSSTLSTESPATETGAPAGPPGSHSAPRPQPQPSVDSREPPGGGHQPYVDSRGPPGQQPGYRQPSVDSRAPSLAASGYRQPSGDRLSQVSGPGAPSVRSMGLRSASQMGGETESVRSGRSRRSYKDMKDSRSIATIDPLATSVRDAQSSLDPIDEWDTRGGADMPPEKRKLHLKVHLGLGIVHLVIGVIVFFFELFTLVYPPRGGMFITGTGIWIGPILVAVGIFFIVVRIKNTYSIAKIGFFIAVIAAALALIAAAVICAEVGNADIKYKTLRREDWNLNRGTVCVSCTEYLIAKCGITIFLLCVDAILLCVSAAVSYIDAGMASSGKHSTDVKTVYVPQPVYIPVPVGSHVLTESVHSMPQSVHSVPPSRGTTSVISDYSSRAGPPRPMTDHLSEANGPPGGHIPPVFDHTRPGAITVGSDRVSVRSGTSSRR